MKKLLLILFLFFIVLVGCGENTSGESDLNNEENNDSELTDDSQTETETEEEIKKYDVDKIIVAESTLIPKGIIDYQYFNTEIVKTIGEKYNIPVEIKELPALDDSMIAINNHDVDVVAGLNSTIDPDVELTYTYFTKPLYLPNGMIFAESMSHKMAVHTDNQELLQLLNDEINSMTDNGVIEEIYQDFFSKRDSKEHITVEEATDSAILEQMEQEEREQLFDELEEYNSIE